ncbi:MAG: HlyD family efflux transporter periplasmic adaptor subunit [Clostridiales bacterium]|nr:HlyD family efflux transporter periplasmic adaptor subunit [Clostridiales bacterium]
MRKEMLNYVKKYSRKRDRNLKYDFMPELLEIIEKPAHIGGKVIIWSIFTLLVVTIIWASVSKIDVVSTTGGTVNPKGSVINVQAKQDGVVNEVLVSNGQYVHKGDILVKIDSSYDNIDVENLSVLSKLADNDEKISEIDNSIKKAENILDNKILRSDTDGYVTNMQEGLTGNVVATGNVLMNIIPDNTPMESTCYVKNSDIADLKIGKAAVIKLEAYPYSEYGTLTGKITYISAGAVSTDEVKNVYVVKLGIENNNDKIKLLPGMTATVEFDLGKRSIMKYFLDPITGALKNTAREK